MLGVVTVPTLPPAIMPGPPDDVLSLEELPPFVVEAFLTVTFTDADFSLPSVSVYVAVIVTVPALSFAT